MIESIFSVASNYLHFSDLHLNPNVFTIMVWGHALSLKWYSIAYIAGLILGWIVLIRMLKQPGAPMAPRHADDLFFYAALGVILGGRVGYVLFYQPEMLLNPLQILQLWDGGMSFHGGAIGASLAMFYTAHKFRLDWMRVHDYVATVAPIGLFFGRCANFVNGELWGKRTDVPWAMVFPNAGPWPRHPSQLYEAGLEGLLLLAILTYLFWKTRARYKPGLLVGTFLLGYGCSRFFVEFFREADQQFQGTFLYSVIHMGQLLTLPMIFGGLYLILTANRRTDRVRPVPAEENAA
ncbi:prolipoprotein diacylglyceryl transferase [Sphingosinithalassobacter portus]|uniref:prolipoprotein diacylglyceryl transferase n=1 Tax=Stakelama portus TaxID=2676234 RepID=UPI000D6DF9A7|nr:prolipoprotein diacylglyceryl transferase [Sphingosinithalassobacter portus]